MSFADNIALIGCGFNTSSIFLVLIILRVSLRLDGSVRACDTKRYEGLLVCWPASLLRSLAEKRGKSVRWRSSYASKHK